MQNIVLVVRRCGESTTYSYLHVWHHRRAFYGHRSVISLSSVCHRCIINPSSKCHQCHVYVISLSSVCHRCIRVGCPLYATQGNLRLCCVQILLASCNALPSFRKICISCNVILSHLLGSLCLRYLHIYVCGSANDWLYLPSPYSRLHTTTTTTNICLFFNLEGMPYYYLTT